MPCSLGCLGSLTKVGAQDFKLCIGCLAGKFFCKSIPRCFKNTVSNTKPLELVHSDVCGPFKALRGGFCYFVTFQDDYTKFAMVYFMAKKSEVFQKFREFSAVATKLHGADILKLHFQHSNRDICKPS